MYLKYVQSSIELLNIRIDEPVTTATDLLMTAVCIFAFFRIRQQESAGRMKQLFQYYFLALGLGAFFGGILGHAFLYRLASPWKLVSWVLILVAVAIMVQALIELSKPLLKPGVARWFVALNLLILAGAVFFTIRTIEFAPVAYYSVFGMFVVVGTLSVFVYRRTGDRGVVWFLGAVALGLVSACIYSFQWGLSPWFNHNDMGHIILIFSILGLFRGATRVLNAPQANT